RFGGGAALTLGSFIPLGLDEKYARYAAWRLGIPLEVLPRRIPRLDEEVVWALDLQDEPMGMISFFPLALLLKRAKSYGKILLTGDGGDEVFLGYGKPGDWTNADQGSSEYSMADRSVVVGVPAPKWMSPWGQYMVGHSLLGHMFPKLDRAAAEQGIEARCPLVDWDLLAYARTLAPQQLLFSGRPKSLLKAQLLEWPHWFVERRKLGFAYRLRWAWGLRRFRGLRDLLTSDTLAAFEPHLPAGLRSSPRQWKSREIFKNFTAVWKLLSWSRFSERLKLARQVARSSVAHAEPAEISASV
ncbi:MAG TPA: asparagine synthase C-terminal domain-containing protein, partial [Gemmataceae bacterium]|nr:asparagine synthase C-terminal domain-containing protein [Gemmataceae bacterium]